MAVGCAVQALGVPFDATIEDPRAVTGRLNKTKHVSTLNLSYVEQYLLYGNIIRI